MKYVGVVREVESLRWGNKNHASHAVPVAPGLSLWSSAPPLEH